MGKEVTNLKRGDRVVVPFTIACGNCIFCRKSSVRMRAGVSLRPVANE
nr:alcohol dehydrogenase catalytic domain-containing protein [Edaphobacter modestus]